MSIARTVLADYTGNAARRRVLGAALLRASPVVRRNRADAPRRRGAVARRGRRQHGARRPGRSVHAEGARRPHRCRQRRPRHHRLQDGGSLPTDQRAISRASAAARRSRRPSRRRSRLHRHRGQRVHRAALHLRVRRRAARDARPRSRSTMSPASPTAAIEGLGRLIAQFDDERTPYRALRRSRLCSALRLRRLRASSARRRMVGETPRRRSR